MRIYIKQKNKTGGPGVFRDRIISAFIQHGIEVIHDDKANFDVELAFINLDSGHGKPKVLRLDGCYYVGDSVSMNRSIVQSVKMASKVIFQSQFSKQMCSNILKADFSNSLIIHNGISFDEINDIAPDSNVVPGSFVACADWRHNKRPISTIKGFIEANTGRHLYMIGDGIKDKIQNKRVHYLGNKKHRDLIAILKACQYQMHLCHIDSCPNAVVEGLACGLNVLHTNLGGTREIVKDNGVMLNCDEPIYGPIPKCDLDKLSYTVIAKGIHSIMQMTERAVRPDLDLKNVCNEYISCLKAVI